MKDQIILLTEMMNNGTVDKVFMTLLVETLATAAIKIQTLEQDLNRFGGMSAQNRMIQAPAPAQTAAPIGGRASDFSIG